ncbi:class I adenylate-forming enzyme family protein [Lentzea aerocolonigenes]|nr:class I adenylate-forming enzyme family protein [Lentzea aerocolonigenes]
MLHELLDRAAAERPDAPAITSGGRRVTYRELAELSLRMADALSGRGVRRGERVLLRSADGLAVAAACYAVSRTGAAFSVLHEEVRGEPLRHVVGDCEPVLLVGDDDSDPEAVRFEHIAALSESSHAAPTDPCPALEVDPACLIYTSGTTSLPKAVVSTHQQMLWAIGAIQQCLNYQPDDVIYCPLPLSFDYGLYQVFLATNARAHLWLGTPAESGPPLLKNLAEAKATVLPGVPPVSDRLAWLLQRGGDLPHLRLLTNTGAALSEKTTEKLRRHLPNLRIALMYGLTECKRTAIMPPDGDLDKPGACGLPLPGTEVFVIDDEGNRVPPGEIGQFVVRGPHVMAGYWRRPELTAERFYRKDGLFPELRTGDYGRMDEDGYLYFSGRRDDIYKERGFRVSATEVEAAANRVQEVEKAAVLPPTEDRKAVLAAVTGISAEEVLEKMREHIEPFKIPRRCVRLESLPTNNNGKIDRRELATIIEGSE